MSFNGKYKEANEYYSREVMSNYIDITLDWEVVAPMT